MDDNERKQLSDTLKKADELMIREIIREAESFLEDQLKAGLAADTRAMTLSAFMAGIVSILITGTGLLVAIHFPIWPHVVSAGVLILALCAALFSTIHAARPTGFYYRGNNPKFWASDIEKGLSLKDALAGQALLYSIGISKNVEILSENHRWAQLGLKLAGLGAIVAAFIEGLVLFIKLGHGP